MKQLATARYIMVGGFLGAGKTTAIVRLARHLSDQGRSVGLITNDQSSGLADTKILRSHGYTVEEVAGGCFCCRFDSLNEAADRLSAAERPDYFVAEPVGSCTDLVATVSYPLRRMYGDRFSVAPLSVLLDSRRAARMFGLAQGPNFSSEVRYVYLKQIEEADIILLNKTDLIDDCLLERLHAFLSENHPEATLIPCRAREGLNLDPWFSILDGDKSQQRPPLRIDYDRYARGEAALGWLNATLRLESDGGVDGNVLLQRLCAAIQQTLMETGFEVAHLKMTLDPGFTSGEIAVVSVVRNEAIPELRASVLGHVKQAALILNLRAEAPPEHLEMIARQAMDQIAASQQIRLQIEDLECFRPARPRPQHRYAEVDGSAAGRGVDDI